MKIKVWGTRGTFPAAERQGAVYGVNTACFTVEWEGGRLILDAGTGLASFGIEALKQENEAPIHIFLSHMHLDHIQGLFIFPLLYSNNAEIHVYGEERDGRTLREQFSDIMRPPFWPVGPESFTADVNWHSIAPGREYKPADGVWVRTLRARHPDQGLIFRVEAEGRSLIYGLDCELAEMDRKELECFCARADALICDATYAPAEYENFRGWGHSTWKDGVMLANKSGIGRVLCSHLAWDKTDRELEALESEAGRCCPDVSFLKEGEIISL